MQSIKSLFFAIQVKTNAIAKQRLWETIARDVQRKWQKMSTKVKRSTDKIQEHVTDWVYDIRKRKKENLSSVDKDLMHVLNGAVEDFRRFVHGFVSADNLQIYCILQW